ncbi:unnamed protein product [Tenebrio molitor]|jgi:hypothetical protein|nr:unnamed protein product [Tenebrio molitor]
MIFHENSDSDRNLPLNLTIIDGDGFTLPKGCEEMKKQYDNLEFSEEDIWICSFPRSGTTWTQEMVWMIVNHFDLPLNMD